MSIFGPEYDDDEKTKKYIYEEISNVEQKYGIIRSGRVSNQKGNISKLYDDPDITIEWNGSERQPRFMLKNYLNEEGIIIYGFRIRGKSRVGSAGPVVPGTFLRGSYYFFSENGEKVDQFDFTRAMYMECGVCAGAIFSCKFLGSSQYVCYEIRR